MRMLTRDNELEEDKKTSVKNYSALLYYKNACRKSLDGFTTEAALKIEVTDFVNPEHSLCL